MTTYMPRLTELEETVARQRQLIEELEDRVAHLEFRLADGHNCAVDLCSVDSHGRCRLAPCTDHEEGS